MNITPDDRVNMSLDELVKASRKNIPKKVGTPANKSNDKKAVGGPNTPKIAKGGNKGNIKAPKSQNSSQKVAKSIGAGNAKRAALTNQRRGLNSTGKASKMEIDKAIKKQTNKVAKVGQSVVKIGGAKRRNGGKKAPGASPIAKAAGLKISFKPSELGQTTDKNVILQIRGALAKSTVGSGGSGGGGAPRKPKARAPRK